MSVLVPPGPSLFLLRPIDPDINPWDPWYDKAFGHVVRAGSEVEARQLASLSAGDEGNQAWLDDQLSTCHPLINHGIVGVVMTDFSAA